MRETLFKGKRTHGICAWVFGVPVKAVDGKTYMITLWDNVGTWKDNPRLLYVEVNPETVGQFTGLLDKNGTGIFEGDIVNAGYENVNGSFFYHYSVVFATNDGSREMCNKEPHFKRLTQITITKNSIEVVGNIHDNPELLEVTI